MHRYIARVKEELAQKARAFSAHPFRYTGKTLGELVAGYWDVGTALLAAYAFDDTGGRTLGALREYVLVYGTLGTVAGGIRDERRFVRNFLSGFAGVNLFGGESPSYSAAHAVTGVVTAVMALYVDRMRRKEGKGKNVEQIVNASFTH